MNSHQAWLGNRFCLAFVCLIISSSQSFSDRPNVLVIMTDDLGFSDLGCYGGEIDTPNLDRLAEQGVRFSQFYNTAKCHSSRVSLLTGQYCIAAGDTALSNAVTSAEVLAEGGYFTAMTGKWHLKREPTDFGFDRYFGHLSGACNFFRGDNTFRLNGERWDVPESDFYTTVANVDFGLKFLDEAREADKPWYLYVAFNAPHAPLHALPDDYAKYKGRYDAGWDLIRSERVKKQKQLGLIPEDLEPSSRPDHLPAWKELEPWRQKYEANRMTTLAAMIDRVDQEVGRLVANLQSNDELENTIILFVSDNGACPYDRRKPILNAEPTSGDVFFGDSTGWAWARNSPFRYYKQNQFEGGISTPAIVHWPAGLKSSKVKRGGIVHQPAHLIDVLPTLSEITGCSVPDRWPARDLRSVCGVSLLPALRGDTMARQAPIHFLFASDRALRDGDWKAVSFRGEAWELYNLREDRTERINLADSEPERLKAMSRRWAEMARSVLHAPKRQYSEVGAAKPQHLHPEWTNFSRGPDEQPNYRQPKPTAVATRKPIRARKDTKLKIEGSQLILQCNGNDSGIAIDRIQLDAKSAGPYQLRFRVRSQATRHGGSLFHDRRENETPRWDSSTVWGEAQWGMAGHRSRTQNDAATLRTAFGSLQQTRRRGNRRHEAL